ncbi:hypothetical protein SAMN05444344_1922 [Tenacibaculum mesophilum]|uniref:Uncharacterized protein n=1 Tax=Tenacibaculum mesophilum TaxID=104268 RepID=A0ABN5T6M8_9FLAO|nr:MULTISPECIES: hypothetical protein [Tenacibaculum]GFD79348.1 hypothetical protein KUL118_22100 [Tenacibaculum sp. KUL118]AZJ32070.1 hypothetical protein D6200_05580 [Tenacibaculum mesophilum]MCO7186369.1 hypothetical protein [Tenacibaculum sp. XPcli2-G]QFS27329.1 hypothetical protein F9Y86_02450 [Tenacibaculum mesophilum]SHF89353.1 hypothetical protein SAMN05444344_1922 [Tenacibaculum mesophilum]
MKTITNKFKLTLAVLSLLAIGTVSAQITGVDIAPANKDIQTGVNKTIRVIDNKGTIKYIQTQNGITTLTNTTNNTTTTTIQLGGTLNSDTTITLNDGTTDRNFTIDGINFNLNNTVVENGAAATADAGQADGISTTGYTLLVRDQATGQVKKLLLSDLIQSGHDIFDSTTTPAVVATANPATLTLVLTNAPQTLEFKNVSVYRNGAKLIANRDYSIIAGATATDPASVSLAPTNTAPYDWSITTEDIIEVHWSK